MHVHTHTHARMAFHNLPTPALAHGRLKCNCGNIGFIAPLFQLRSIRPKTETHLTFAMATGVVKYPPKPTQLYILYWLTYPENLVKIHALV